ncbi:MAG: hypothetical protein KA586_00110 [Candidatus Promineofilum sp.]|nr:hypothetical protein [Promineifilum sp.]
MNEFQATTVLVALFALRCVAPLVLMAAIAYGMKRLVIYWDAQEANQPRPQPAIALTMAAPMRSTKPALPCWLVKNCDAQTRDACPAYANQSLACWVARLRADGQVPARCAGCELYSGAPAFAAGD